MLTSYLCKSESSARGRHLLDVSQGAFEFIIHMHGCNCQVFVLGGEKHISRTFEF